MTGKTKFNNTQTHEHQFAIGTTPLGGLGYPVSIGKGHNGININFEVEYPTAGEIWQALVHNDLGVSNEACRQ